MDPRVTEDFLLIIKRLESTPYRDLALNLKERLAQDLRDTRIDFQGKQHERSLDNFIDRYPNLLHVGRVFPYLVNKLLHSNELARPYQKPSINIIKSIHDRRRLGQAAIPRALVPEFYSRLQIQKKIMGHLTPAYCCAFDRTGHYIFTGADDHLIKIWSARNGKLLKTLRGHNGEILDISVNYENSLLASAGNDKIIRIWDLKTSKLLECLSSHSATVTSVKFAPYNRHGSDRYLISTSNDGSIVFWTYHVDSHEFKMLSKIKERNRPGGQITCSSFSAGGSFLACGASDNFIHVYGFHPINGPYWISELPANGKVDSVEFCNNGLRFVSGSKDGTAAIWNYKDGEFKPLILNQTITPGQKPPTVLIVAWSRDDRYVLTSIVDYSIKVWDSYTGELIHVLRGHGHDIYLLESHPIDPRILVSASHDGTVSVWDVNEGRCLNKLHNYTEQESTTVLAAIYDVKFSPQGDMLATVDSHGCLNLCGFGTNSAYEQIPAEMFFHSDYRPLIRDVRNFVMDEYTHIAPHLMPRPTLVDMNGNPYHNILQGLVPDYKSGDLHVIEPLKPTQLECFSEIIRRHSIIEDNDFIAQKKEPGMCVASDSDATEIDSDATEIDDNVIVNPRQRINFLHNLRTRSYGVVRENEREDTSCRYKRRRHSERLRDRKRNRN